MAGMDWFRWHHGSVTDPKFQLVARKSGASLPDVLAVWAYILETASQSVERGDFGSVDCEALDCLFGFPATETRTADILAAMQARELVDGSRVLSWEKRQPKREREDSTNAERQATFRAKQNQVTPDNARDEQKTPREEKSREEEKEEKTKDRAVALRPVAYAPPDWVPSDAWQDFVRMRKAIPRSAFTDAAAKGVVADLKKLADLGHDPGELLRTSVVNSWKTVYAPRTAAANSNRTAAQSWADRPYV